MAAPHRAHERARCVRAGRAWLAIRCVLPRALAARLVPWWPHRWTLQAQIVAPLVETCAPLALLLHVAAGRRRSCWSRVLGDGWPLDVARDSETMGGRCPLLECDACGGWSRAMRAGRVMLRAASCAAVRNFSSAVASGRPPLRRCRDGWSDFF
ncbi:U-box domain-containing protein 50-like [Dorcoceras hygrometricum]|uniref:U-box domain-containing protein 50-like n=1 Tax=Dorcoceras hygrometricum TaxID=472368 RepID=A0A2Z7ANJ3_9LAMI|nr:U-box domain-containing protein 50-like [Dorcoceras hygrometricum]